MKLKLSKQQRNVHTNIVGIVNWAPNNQVYSYSDDGKILTWETNGEYTGKFMDMDTYYTSADWNLSLKNGNEILALGSADGHIKIVGRNGKVEKVVTNAHSMAITSLQWSPDGTTLITSSEDGQVKTWSKQGELRNNLVKDSNPIYCARWNHDASFYVYTCGNMLNIESQIKSGFKPLKWKAHDEVILCLDWNFANKFIISGGEDRRYKIWDQYGRNLYSSMLYNSVITSIAWAPSGEYFAVGSFMNIRLCNKTGWAYSFSKVDSGGIMSLSWSNDGTTLAAAGVIK